MSDFSVGTIKGTLGRDPESRATPNGDKVVNFSVAVGRGYGDKKTTDWWNITTWGKQADFAEKYLKKGKRVFVTGELQLRSWTDKQGVAKLTPEIKADRVEFADDGGSGESKTPVTRQERAAPAARQQAAPAARASAPASDESDPFGDDIPF